MDFIILEKILNGLQLPVDYLQKFRDQCLDDKTMELTMKDEDRKEELRHIVSVAASCAAVWQFLDYHIYDMVQKSPLPPGVSEVAALLSQE
ncbi:unnamed protein product [Allacma fusca]|uniref:Uncharacterized protein n=1 Tax=Allacma fusca TaxID=39272 RepID=A0A8J2PP44_9HEXA|nr:unnamed protein product [Allacma fusca]